MAGEQAAPTPQPSHDDVARGMAEWTEQWNQDRATEAGPLPGAGQTHYTGEAQRQAALAAAERANIANAAGQLGMTSSEWRAKREELGRSPTRNDV